MKCITVRYPVEQETLNIYPLSDVHRGEKNENYKAVMKYIETIKNDPNGACIVNGDIMNMATKTSVSDIYEEQLNPMDAMDSVADMLRPIKDKILAITEGNHELRAYHKEGILISKLVAMRLDILERYTTGAYLLFVSLGSYNNAKHGDKDRQYTYSIYGKHGRGGGRKIGAKAIRLNEMSLVCDADVFIHSHTHVPMSFRQQFKRVDYRNKTVQDLDQLFVNSNAWLDFGGYGETYGYTPASIEPPLIILNGTKKLAKCLL